MPRFRVRLICEALIEISDGVIAAVDDDWRKDFYSLAKPSDIASHIAYNLVANGASLSDLDGFADREDDEARLISAEWDFEGEGVRENGK